jgi:peptide deformylase
MAVKEILLLGNPALYEVSEAVEHGELNEIADAVTDLHDTMMDFRKRYDFGRAIAAPQIGVRKRLFYLHIDEPVAFVNPELTGMSDEMIEIWDDCMSFPGLSVRVRRHRRCRIRYRDLSWSEREMDLEGDLAELIQHEYDHLDGVLAVMRAIDAKSFSIGPPGAFSSRVEAAP